MPSGDETTVDPLKEILSKKFKKKVGRPKKEKTGVEEKRKYNRIIKTTTALKKKKGIKSCKIPKTVFDKTQILINFPGAEKLLADSNSCHSFAHNVEEVRRSDLRNGQEMQLLNELKLTLIQRDWVGLMKVLSMAKPYTHQESCRFFPLCIRYAILCLAHNRGFNLLDDLLQGVALCVTEEDKLELFREMVKLD